MLSCQNPEYVRYSAFVDNIPFVATMIPLIQDMGRLGGIADLEPLWWSLSLGGNGTIIGASANVVVAGLAEKRGIMITFISFTKVAFPMMLMSIVLCTGYLLPFFLRWPCLIIYANMGKASLFPLKWL